jgi:hypothetical protein
MYASDGIDEVPLEVDPVAPLVEIALERRLEDHDPFAIA